MQEKIRSIKNYNDVIDWKIIGKEVSEDYIWKVFKRHNWTKKTPRPEHPKTDYEKQEEFKKNSMKIWQAPV